MSTNAQKGKPCRFFAQGECRYGAGCKFSHDQGISSPASLTVKERTKTKTTRPPRSKNIQKAEGSPSPQVVGDQPPQIHVPVARRGVKRGGKPCHAWAAGSCPRGDACHFVHDPKVQEIARRREQERAEREEASRRAQAAQEEVIRTEQERIREEARQVQDEQRAVREAEHRARMAEIAREEAAMTSQCVVLGSIVTFETGLGIRGIITGFESCVVRVKNLPGDAREDEVRTLFTQQGIQVGHFHVVGTKRTPGGKLEAEVVTDAESGQTLAIGLDNIEFRDTTLTFEVGAYNSPGGMSATAAKPSTTLTISWRAPSAQYVAEFDDIPSAQRKVPVLNQQFFSGRKVRVELNTLPPGRIVRSFRPNAIKISNLPTTVTDDDVTQFTGSHLVRRLMGASSRVDTVDDVVAFLRNRMNLSHPHKLQDLTSQAPRVDGTVSAEARFASWDDAHEVQESLAGKQFPCIGNSRFWFRLPDSLQYTITIPPEQYQAQKTQWASLVGSIKDRKACNLFIHEQDRFVRIRVSGSDKRATGALKVRVESLMTGEKVAGWHRSLGFSRNAFVRSVFIESGAYLRADWRRQALKLYGEPVAVEQAREMIKAELERLASTEWSTVLKRESVGFFVRRGIPELKETFGEDSVRFDIASRRVTITGGDEPRHAFDRLIHESLNSVLASQAHSSTDKTCPICYDDVSTPFELGCGHIYCTACLRHFLVSAVDSTNFPLTCMGDEAKCGVPIAIPTIQKFLPPASFNRLVEVVFNAHVATHPRDFKYCKTPDCNQIYRSANPTVARALQCPSCFSTVCASCHEDAHQDMSCAEYKARSDPAEQERLNDQWIAEQGGRVKKCPQCQVLIEKLEGCNHMSCKCGAHICWRCMGIFTRNTIYPHMHEVHGGIHDAGPIFELRVDLAEQRELLRQAARLREQRQRANLAPNPRPAFALWGNEPVYPREIWRDAEEREREMRILRAQRQQERVERERREERQRDLRRQWLAQQDRERQERERQERERRERQQQENRGWCTVM
ncbi:uncharacterized protein FIBRA_07557 [Fibroporia radiculosa]|uniref:RBR-type E3 ubiquitin transferase n=1 Tax=Fibroporia radiculosa TaxID=599839 RepID=J4GEW0_9APHY|nr:uncharacterized protein FIBRA_07557 [Fibroporia radiculosa]CCM05343.1 predicted protein [Fibroporia radiculosa]